MSAILCCCLRRNNELLLLREITNFEKLLVIWFEPERFSACCCGRAVRLGVAFDADPRVCLKGQVTGLSREFDSLYEKLEISCVLQTKVSVVCVLHRTRRNQHLLPNAQSRLDVRKIHGFFYWLCVDLCSYTPTECDIAAVACTVSVKEACTYSYTAVIDAGSMFFARKQTRKWIKSVQVWAAEMIQSHSCEQTRVWTAKRTGLVTACALAADATCTYLWNIWQWCIRVIVCVVRKLHKIRILVDVLQSCANQRDLRRGPCEGRQGQSQRSRTTGLHSPPHAPTLTTAKVSHTLCSLSEESHTRTTSPHRCKQDGCEPAGVYVWVACAEIVLPSYECHLSDVLLTTLSLVWKSCLKAGLPPAPYLLSCWHLKVALVIFVHFEFFFRKSWPSPPPHPKPTVSSKSWTCHFCPFWVLSEKLSEKVRLTSKMGR